MASLAAAVDFQRHIIGCRGWVQAYRIGRTFSNRCARGRLFWNYLAHVLFICHEVHAATHGFTRCRAYVSEPALLRVELAEEAVQSLPR